jgi:class 3 adenylate cyclase
MHLGFRELQHVDYRFDRPSARRKLLKVWRSNSDNPEATEQSHSDHGNFEGKIGPEADTTAESGGVAVKTGAAAIELTINRDFASYCPEDMERLLCAVKKLLEMDTDLVVVRKRPGSVKLTLQLTPQQAERLLWAARTGELDEFGVTDADLLESTSILDRQVPSDSADSDDQFAEALGGTTGRDAEVLRHLQLASMREKFAIPANGIVETFSMLLSEVSHVERDDFRADLLRLERAARTFQTLIQQMFDSAATPDKPIIDSAPYHRLRTLLNHVIGFCDLWLEDVCDHFLERCVDDLQRIKALAREVLNQIDAMFSACRASATTPGNNPILELPEMVCDLARPRPTDGLAPRGRILVADDNELNRDMLGVLLSREGHTVVKAANGRQALDLVKSQSFDLILLEIIMPEVTGFQVLESLKADPSLSQLPVLMISALQESENVARCVEMGADDYVYKPFNPVILRASVNACLEKKRLRDREVEYLQQIQKVQQRSDELLHVILPAPIVAELKETKKVQPRRHENVAVMFCDIVGFTPYCDHNPPEQVVAYLQQLMEEWERIVLVHGVEKFKTIGDSLMAAAGLLQPSDNPVLSCVRCGLEIIAAAQMLPISWNVRVGIHAGPVVAGVIGKQQFQFDLWGDTVNTAARMKSHGVPGAVVLSETAWQQIAHCSRGVELGVVQLKGKGNLEMVRFEGFMD